jgi:hypothetical protein
VEARLKIIKNVAEVCVAAGTILLAFIGLVEKAGEASVGEK